ncbi:MAG: hypothetical protein KDC71_05320 [Acidobacteria bacterium]|nr:hypothetical protein [Acidobacteriota bacterium]
MLFIFFLFANCDLRTNIQDIYYRGTCEESGSITMSVQGDEYPTASPTTPVFIRIRLNENAKLCSTLVDLSGSTGNNSEPIFLALRFEGSNSTNRTVSADPYTLSIVRWREGEDQLWLRVQSPTNTWLTINGTPQAPNPNNAIAWTLGVTARNSWTRNSGPFGLNLSNLPCNSTHPEQIFLHPAISEAWALSTLLCVDVSQSTIEPLPSANSLVTFEQTAWDATTSGVTTSPIPASIVLGNPFPTGICAGDDVFARGVNVTNAINLPNNNSTLHLPGEFGAPPLTFAMEIQTSIYMVSTYGRNGASYMCLQTAADSFHGFPLEVIDGEPVSFEPGSYKVQGWTTNWGSIVGPFVYFTPQEEAFLDAGGNWLTRKLFLRYDGPDNPYIYTTITLHGSIWQYAGYWNSTIELSAFAQMSNRSITLDEPPFNGTFDDQYDGSITPEQQRRRCPASFQKTNTVYWQAGTFPRGAGVPALSVGKVALLIVLLGITMGFVAHKQKRRTNT